MHKVFYKIPNVVFLHKGDVLHSIFYLSNGSMEVLQDGMVVAILGQRRNKSKKSTNLSDGTYMSIFLCLSCMRVLSLVDKWLYFA